MVQIEQTEFWSDVDAPSADSTSFVRRGDAVYVDETASLTDWFLEEADEPGVEARPESIPAPVEPVPDWIAEPDQEAGVLSVAERAHATVACHRGPVAPTPRFNMARFLTLTGSLDRVEEDGRYLVLPRRSFRPRVMLDAVRRISKDFLKDLRSPPRSHSITQYQRPPGWLKL